MRHTTVKVHTTKVYCYYNIPAKASLALLYVSTYVTRVCNHTRLPHTRMDAVQGVFIEKNVI